MFALASLAALTLATVASGFSVSTPASIELCKPTSWDIIDGGSATYTAYFVYGDNPCGDELYQIGGITGGSFSWTVNMTIPAGESIMVALDDGTNEAWSGAVTVTGSDTSCFTAAAVSSSSSTSASSSTHSTTHAATYTAPVNAASNVSPTASDAAAAGNGAGSRAALGLTSALAVIGAAVVGLSL